jgi:phage FluMu gp28-like protein
MGSPASSAAIPLYAYQRRWIEDESRFKIALKARQTGFSFAVALEVVLDSLEHRTTWILLSRGERQSKELMEKCQMHAKAIGYVLDVLESEVRIDDKDIKLLEIRLPNGSKIIGLPANPDTARGFSGNVVLDEFAFHKDSRKIWAALFPVITRGYKIRVISTPQGKSGQFYSLWTETSGRWSKHKVDIYGAVADGLEIDIEELRAGIETDDDWAQEYECEFIDEAAALLTYDLIAQCEHEGATIVLPEDLDPTGPLFVGMDIGRKRDLSVIWLDELLGDVFWTRAVIEMAKTKFRVQRETLYEVLRMPNVVRACIDSTGIGAQLAEEAIDEFGRYRVEAVDFTMAVKSDLATTMLRVFQDKQTRIPIETRIRQDLHKVRKITTSAGNVRYDAASDDEGHADRFWAKALCLHASDRAEKTKRPKLKAHVA